MDLDGSFESNVADKNNTVLIGYRDPEHRRLPICKIADFGEAQEIPKNPMQQKEYYMRGAIALSPPVGYPSLSPTPSQPYLLPHSSVYTVQISTTRNQQKPY